MPYTLKVDWTRQRIKAVNEALSLKDNAVPSRVRSELRATMDLAEYLDEGQCEKCGATLKFELSTAQLDSLERALESSLAVFEQMMLVARDNKGDWSYEDLVALQTQAFSAGRDIRLYRAAVAKVQNPV